MIRHQGCQERTNSASKSTPNCRSSADLRCGFDGFPFFSIAHGQLKSHPIPPFWLDGSTFEALPLGESLQALVSHGFSSQPCLSQASLCPKDFNSKTTCRNDPTCIQGFIRFLWLPIPSISIPSYPIYSVFQSLMSIMCSQSANLTSSCLGIRRKQFSAIWVTLCMSLSCRIEQVWLTP